MANDRIRHGLLVQETLKVLRDASAPMQFREVAAIVDQRINPTPYERELLKDGSPRWETSLGWNTGTAATIGWMTKRGGWSITEAGIEALETYTTPEEIDNELTSRYREIDLRRKKAQQNLNEFHQFIADTLRLVEAGSWTANDDLAELAGTSADEVADFLASGRVKMPNAYRVLNADGSIPEEGMLNVAYRGGDLCARLAEEGVNFDDLDHASQRQRLTAEDLKEFLDAARGEIPVQAPMARRAWMIRGTNVDGFNLVHDWLRYGFVSLSASQLDHIRAEASYDELKQAVENGYQHKSYAYRGQRLEEFDRFLRRIREHDLVVAPMQGKIYVGMVDGDAYFAETAASHSNLRRNVTWFNAEDPIDGATLQAPIPALLQSQAYVVDLTEAYDQIIGPFLDDGTALAAVEEPAREPLAFNPVTQTFANGLLMDQAELAKIADLLWEQKQIIFYGPPGTGKTFLAQALARHLSVDGAVKLVQFHPSYTYEDFFEGFRPEPGGSGTLTFTLRAGPFRDFAEVAKANPSTPYILIIDEINRANLAKVFGELYFLLEYRDQPVSLQYSPDKEFTLPENLFIIGTMNTADRSIARIDTAMRRRFKFVELDPRIPPVRGLLSRWLEENELPVESAQLLDELNRRIEDSDAAIGPSYFMDKRIYERPDGLERVWQYELMPLLEDLFYGQRDLVEQYGLDSLRKAITTAPAEPEP